MVERPEANAAAATPDETELVLRVRSGDGRAFDELVSRYERAIYTLARRILRHTEDAEDATQDAFMSALEHLAELRDASGFGPWLRRIAARSALQILRRRRTDTALPTDPLTGEAEAAVPPGLPDFIAPWRQDPHSMLERAETRHEYVDGSLDPAVCEEWDRHLADCHPCRVVVDNVRGTITLYKEDRPYDLPEAFRRRLHDLLRSRWSSRPR